MTSDFMPPTTFAKGKAKKAEVKENRPWVHIDGGGNVTRMERCWSDPDGCGKYVFAGDFDHEHHLCRECCRAIETNWQVPQTMVGIVLACIRLDRVTTRRVREINKDPQFLETWNQTMPQRVRWLLDKMGYKADKIDREATKVLSVNFFKGAIINAGGTVGKGSGLV